MTTPILQQSGLLALTPEAATPAVASRRSLDDKRSDDAPPPTTSRRVPAWILILGWISLSTAVIFQNREILVGRNFAYPVTLTSLHLLFQSIGAVLSSLRCPQRIPPDDAPMPATRLLHHFTDLISGPMPPGFGEYNPVPLKDPEDAKDGGEIVGRTDEKAQKAHWKRQSVEMDWPTWTREIFPIGMLFSLSLVLSNWAYLYCSVAFIHILKSISPVAILLAAFAFRTKAFSVKLLFIVFTISFGVGIASWGEVNFSIVRLLIVALFPLHNDPLTPFSPQNQMVAIAIEATRVTLIQLLLTSKSNSTNSSASPMSPLKSLYYFAPICFLINTILLIALEGAPALGAIPNLGFWYLLGNASLTFLLNLSAVMLIGLSTMVLSLSKIVKDILMVVSPALLLGESPPRPLEKFNGRRLTADAIPMHSEHQLTPPQILGYGIATVRSAFSRFATVLAPHRTEAGLIWYKLSPS
ncbi:SPOSA6832_01213, partial [Sporobolomyces salmonicolor]